MSAVPVGPAQLADERMTSDREEAKFLVPSDRAGWLAARLTEHLAPHRFTGEGANHLPDASHRVTTIYFDTPGRTHYRAAVGDVEHNVKIRAKEYYDLHSSLAELATDPDEIVRYQPWIWFELKRRDGARTMKHRFRLPKRQVPECLAGGQVVPDALALSSGELASSEGERAGIQEIIEYCRGLDEPLSAVCLVNYRRLSWQDRDGALRVTLDSDLAFFRVPDDLWQRRRPLVREELGEPRGRQPQAILEIKRRGAEPAWLAPILADAKAWAVRYSKFAAAAGAVQASAEG